MAGSRGHTPPPNRKSPTQDQSVQVTERHSQKQQQQSHSKDDGRERTRGRQQHQQYQNQTSHSHSHNVPPLMSQQVRPPHPERGAPQHDRGGFRGGRPPQRGEN